MTHRVVFSDHTFDDLSVERDILSAVDAEVVDGEATDESLESLVEGADALLVMFDQVEAGEPDPCAYTLLPMRRAVGDP